MKLNELRLMVRNELELFLEEFAAKEMPNGSAWKTKNKGWAAKNNNGVVNYWYGPDEAKNKAAANAYKNDSSKKATNELNQSTLQSYKQKSKNSMERETEKTLRGDSSADHSKAQKRARGIATATDKLNTKDYQKPGQKSSIPTDKQKKKQDYIRRTNWQDRNRS